MGDPFGFMYFFRRLGALPFDIISGSVKFAKEMVTSKTDAFIPDLWTAMLPEISTTSIDRKLFSKIENEFLLKLAEIKPKWDEFYGELISLKLDMEDELKVLKELLIIEVSVRTFVTKRLLDKMLVILKKNGIDTEFLKESPNSVENRLLKKVNEVFSRYTDAYFAEVYDRCEKEGIKVDDLSLGELGINYASHMNTNNLKKIMGTHSAISVKLEPLGKSMKKLAGI